MMYFDRTLFHLTLGAAGATESYRQAAIFKANIQPATAEVTAMVNGIYGQTFTAYTTYSGLAVNEAVMVSGTTTLSGMFYQVKGVQPYNYGPLQHFQVVLTLPEK